MSKLAALAAKRRQQGSEQSATASNDTVSASSQDYTASLQKLRLGQTRSRSNDTKTKNGSFSPNDKLLPGDDAQLRGEEESVTEAVEEPPDPSTLVESDVRGTPSLFASIMTSQKEPTQHPRTAPLSSNEQITSPFDFTQPSPDDIVTKAQNVKSPR